MDLGKMFFDVLKMINPEEIAMVDKLTGDAFTYGNFHQGSARLALKLEDLGLRGGDVVGIVSENRAEFFVPVLACFYKCLVVHPMNSAYTATELKSGFDSSKPKVIFTSDGSLPTALQIQAETDYIRAIINFDDQVYKDMVGFGEALQTVVINECRSENDAALILSSSGTTGLPKGVILTRINVKSSIAYLTYPYLHFSPANVTVGVMPFHHLFGLFIGLACVLFLSKMVILSKFKPDVYCEIIQQYRVSSIQVVPMIAVILAKRPMVDRYDLTSVTDVVCGAAPLGSEIQAILEKKFKCTVRQMYGMTETCGLISMLPFGVKSKAGSVGLLIPGIRARIVDTDTKQPGAGTQRSGEICVKSALNMKGYCDNEAASEGAWNEDGFIRTGDIGYMDEDGYIFIIDRLKDLIKYKGFQIAPAELEDLLMSRDDVLEAAVVGIADEGVGERPMAFVVKSQISNATEADLIEFVNGREAAMLCSESSRFCILDIADNISIHKRLRGGVKFVQEIPKGPTGKTLRRVLRQLAASIESPQQITWTQ